MRHACLIGLLAVIFCVPVRAQVGPGICGGLENNYGPFDYRSDKQKPGYESYETRRRLVEGAHFTFRVESGQGAQAAGQVGPAGPDLSYTMRVFPNHHRGLIAVMRYAEKYKSDTPPGLQFTVECYMERAIRFAGDDPLVFIIYATFLTSKNRDADALAQLDYATKVAGDNGFTHYNIGLAYFDLKQYVKSLASAHRAMATGFIREGLIDKLKAVGQWREPEAVSETASAAAAAAASASAAEPAKP